MASVIISNPAAMYAISPPSYASNLPGSPPPYSSNLAPPPPYHAGAAAAHALYGGDTSSAVPPPPSMAGVYSGYPGNDNGSQKWATVVNLPPITSGDGTTIAIIKHSYGLTIAASIFSGISLILTVLAAALPWFVVTDVDTNGTKLTYNFGLLYYSECRSNKCTNYLWGSSGALSSGVSVVGITGAVAVGFLSIAVILHFVAFISSTVMSCGSRKAMTSPAVEPEHCGCTGTAFTGTALTATAFTFVCVGGLIGNFFIPRAYFATLYPTADFPGSNSAGVAFGTSLISMSLLIASKCHLRRGALSNAPPSRTVIASLLGGSPEACCCC